MRRELYVIIAFTGLLHGYSASGENRDIYVSPAGRWFGPGSLKRPLSGIQKAIDRARPGDVVHVMAGRYSGFEISQSGTSENRITIAAEGDVVITNKAGYGIYIRDASHLVIEGFHIKDTGLKGIAAREATPDDPMRDLIIRNNTISDTQEEGMYLSEVSDSLIEDNDIRDVGLGRVQTSGHGIYLANAGSKNTIIRGNTIEAPNNTWGEAIHMNGDASVGGNGLINGARIERNRISGFNNGLSLDGVQNSDIVNNVIIDTHRHGIRGYCIDAAEGSKDLRIVNNTIRVSAGNAIKLTDEAGASVIFNNVLIGGEGATVFEHPQKQSANLEQVTLDAALHPDPQTRENGLLEFEGVRAPDIDIGGRERNSPIDIGAISSELQ